ncbi:MAG: hypothetical protein M9954_00695 [Cyclobacteriaceae bacterium]|nr:hypothetical protein [Cyclobacteriaceae bacterium]
MAKNMARLSPFLLVFMVVACQGKLTERQKKEMWARKKAHEIVKISDAEITEAAYQYGRAISAEIRKSDLPHLGTPFADSLQQKYQVKIHLLFPDGPHLMGLEQQLVEAYKAASGKDLTDNVQKIEKDSLLYTWPITESPPGKPAVFLYAVGISMPKKAVILSMLKG